MQERTEWHRLTMYRRLAEIAGEYLKKGSQIYVEGKLQTRKWQDQSGQDRYTTEIIVDQMQMLGGRGGEGGGGNAGGGYQRPQNNQQGGYQQQGGQSQGGYQQQGGQNQGGQNQGGYQQPAPNQGGGQSQPKQPPMAEPDFDFDDDIPF